MIPDRFRARLFLSPVEVAELIPMSAYTIRRRCKEGHLGARKDAIGGEWLIPVGEVWAWLGIGGPGPTQLQRDARAFVDNMK